MNRLLFTYDIFMFFETLGDADFCTVYLCSIWTFLILPYDKFKDICSYTSHSFLIGANILLYIARLGFYFIWAVMTIYLKK